MQLFLYYHPGGSPSHHATWFDKGSITACRPAYQQQDSLGEFVCTYSSLHRRAVPKNLHFKRKCFPMDLYFKRNSWPKDLYLTRNPLGALYFKKKAFPGDQFSSRPLFLKEILDIYLKRNPFLETNMLKGIPFRETSSLKEIISCRPLF